MQRLARSDATAALAVSGDGALVAHAFRREVQLHDATTGAAVGPPLQSDSDANDVIVQLAFAPDGSRLLARTVQGHWRSWSIQADTRAVAQIAALAAQAGVGRDKSPLLRVSGSRERLAMRRRDPGAWPAPIARPSLDWASLGDGIAIPPRTAATSPLMVDLTSTYSAGPEMVRILFYNIRSQMRPLPAGLQRIAGTDYDLRGLAQINIHSEHRPVGAPKTTRTPSCLAVAPVPTAAFHVLLEVSTPRPVPPATPLAIFSLHYVDGGQADIPLRAQHEVPGFSGSDEDVPMALAIRSALVATGYTDPGLANPRLANPFPGRPIRCVELANIVPLNPLLLFAITAEPVHAMPVAPEEPSPVIAANKIRTGVRTDPPTAQDASLRHRPPSP